MFDRRTMLAVLAASFLPFPARRSMAQAQHVDTALPFYEPPAGLSGRVRSVGSQTVGSLVARWSDAFKVIHPDVVVEIRAGGTGTAFPALINEGVELAPMSRLPTQEERDVY